MAIALLVATNQVNEPHNYLDDIIQVFPDDWTFTDYELANFEFLIVNGSVEDVNARLEQLKPRIALAYTMDNGELTFDSALGNGGEQYVWQVNGRDWFRLNQPFKFWFNIGSLTAEEKELLATIDINNPSVDAYIAKLLKDISVLPVNTVSVPELKNLDPIS